LSVVDTRHPRTIHTLPVGNGLALDAATVAAQGGLIVVGDSTAMHVFDARTGKQRPMVSSGYAGVLAIDPGGKQVYVATGAGVQVVRLSDSRVVSTIAVQGEIRAMAVDARRHRLFIVQGDTSHNGTLSMIDLRRKAMVATRTVGLAPTALAVDTQSGRVVVVNQGGSRQVTDRWGFLPDWLRTRLSPILGDPSRIQPVPGSISIIEI
jgi:DNA-binding beta-propeller fold protein YncE